MRPLRSRPATHCLSWLLWLALLLPLAQAAAAWHAVSHAVPHTAVGSSERPASDTKPALHPVHCDLCLTAAALGGGALPTAPLGLVHPAARHQAPRATPDSPWLPPVTRAYHSRAPPFVLH
jgi:hypothetical protein